MFLGIIIIRPAHAAPAEPPKVPLAVLYDQYNNAGYGAVISDYDPGTSYSNYNSEAADDFVVPAGGGWTIGEVDVAGSYSTYPVATGVNVIFYNDGGNVPGGVIYSTTVYGAGGLDTGNFTIPLPTSLVLAPGHYWVAVQGALRGDQLIWWEWADRKNVSGDRTQPAMWRNPSGDWGKGCTGWGRRQLDCGWGYNEPEQVFRVLGTTIAPPATATRTGTPTRTPIPVPTDRPTITSTPTHPPTNTPRPTNTPVPIATVTPCTAGVFSDVQAGDYFAPAVAYLAAHDVVSGYNDCTFRPYANTTRAQLAKIVVAGFDLPPIIPVAGEHTFADVAPGSTFFNFIEAAVHGNIISGYTCGSVPSEPCDDQRRPYYRPASNVTRGQLAKIVVSSAGWPLLTPPQATFADVPVGNVFYSFVETAACHGIISGYTDGSFRPGNSATRGQISKIVYLAVTYSGTACNPPTATPTATITMTATVTATSTLIPPTATVTATLTAIPPTATATATSTALPTATATATDTATSTPGAVTATATWTAQPSVTATTTATASPSPTP